MKRKLFIVAVIMTVICLSGCGKSEVKESVSEASETETQEAALITETQDSSATEEQAALSPEETYRQKYEYLLAYDSLTYDGTEDFPIVTGFNFPYKFDDFYSTSHHYDMEPSEYRIDIIDDIYYEIDGDDSTKNSSIRITTEEYNITEDGKLVYYNPDYTGEAREYDIEERGEVETAQGIAKLYSAKQSLESGTTFYNDVAILNINGYAVTIFYGEDNMSAYSGKLEQWLPILFQEIAVDENKVFEFEENYVTAEEGYENYMYTYEWEEKILGFHSLIDDDEWYGNGAALAEDGDNLYFTYSCCNYNRVYGNTGDNLQITTNEGLYHYYFGGRSNIEIEEKAQVDTPVGTARIFYVISNGLDEVTEQEVAIVNNYEENIIFEYSSSEMTDRTYQGNLEALLPELLN